MTAKTTPSTIPMLWASTEMMTVLRRPWRIVRLNWKRRTTSKRRKSEPTAARTTQAASSRMTAALIHRPQCRTGTATAASGSAEPGPLRASVDLGRLHGTLADVPLGQDPAVGSVVDDRLQGGVNGVA